MANSGRAMHGLKTYTATIYCGLRPGYKGREVSTTRILRKIQAYCDDVGLCVTVTPTTFVYTKGRERGLIIGLINYPRFPARPADILRRAKELASMLLDEARQNRISIVATDRTIMISNRS